MRGLLGIILSILFFSCQDNLTSAKVKEEKQQTDSIKSAVKETSVSILNGDERLALYLPLLKDKNVGMVVNQSSVIGKTHLLDTLIASGITVKKIFAPEHGIRGKADAGETVNDGKDSKTGIPVISIYGDHKKPYKKDLEGLDVVVFDLQDVGVRFFTYISTMHYVMEACAENDIKVIILDRPNPNGDYIAGPILEQEHSSFIGLHSIPIVHGLTVGELAHMINGEGWLKDSVQADITVIECKDYTHDTILPLTIKPSPNLPTHNSIRWYPSLCLLEATEVSIGRGTYFPFEVLGDPTLDSTKFTFSFTPKSIDGMSKHPKHQDKKCYGINFQNIEAKPFSYDYLVATYNAMDPETFVDRERYFYLLCGTKRVYKALKEGKSSQEITALFEDELNEYRTLRKKYLLYPE